MKKHKCESSTGTSEPRGPIDGLPTSTRREALQLIGVGGFGLLAGCATDDDSGVAANASGASGAGGEVASGPAAIGGNAAGPAGSAGTGTARGTATGTSGGSGAAAANGGKAGAAGNNTGVAGASGSNAGGASGDAGAVDAAGRGTPIGGAGGTGAGGTGAGGAGAGGAAGASDRSPVICPDDNTPPVPEGPYYYDSKMNRSDITDGKTGVAVTYRFTLLDRDCNPVEGAVIDIWQTDKEGVYSAFAQQGTAGELFLRGFQYTDAKGEATFKAIFPGWYNGRLTHLHGKIFIDGAEQVTTNFFYPKDVEEAVYASPLYAARGQNRTSVAQDIELRGDQERFDALTMSFTGDVASGYVATLVLKQS